MRYSLFLLFAFSMAPACVLLAKSPALSSPLQERLAKADTSTIEQGARACLTKGGWTPDDVGGEAEGATIVSAKNAAKNRVSVYIQPPGLSPRVTGDPAYDDPFWTCLGNELASAKATATAATSGSDAP